MIALSYWGFIANFLFLLWIGARTIAQPHNILGQLATIIYFSSYSRLNHKLAVIKDLGSDIEILILGGLDLIKFYSLSIVRSLHIQFNLLDEFTIP
jgi:hypothetical protein